MVPYRKSDERCIMIHFFKRQRPQSPFDFFSAHVTSLIVLAAFSVEDGLPVFPTVVPEQHVRIYLHTDVALFLFHPNKIH